MQVDNDKDIDVVVPMYNLVEYSDNYSKSLWQYCKDILAVNNNDDIVDFKLLICLILKKNNRSNRKWWNKRSWSNGTIKILKQVLENSWNVFN